MDPREFPTRGNDFLRVLIALALRLYGFGVAVRHRLALRTFAASQRRLRRRYGITDDTPLTRELPPAAERARSPVALTSGTGGSPKEVSYPPRRLRLVRRGFIHAMARLIAAQRIRRTGLYVFSALEADRSLSSLMAAEQRPASRLALLQAPYRAHNDPALNRLQREYGAAAARLLVLAVSNPGILYATNPSTLTLFFDDIEAEWEKVRALARAALEAPEARRTLAKLASAGFAGRLERVAASPAPLPISAWAPAAAVCVCWTSGAAAPFLEALDRRLPAPPFRRIPMFSMSTETLETIPDYRGEDTALVPAASGVLYEFLDADGTERASSLLRPADLIQGRQYEMVVSHAFGLRRYATGDLFGVERRFRGQPDLRFVRRRGLGWSFTGEKLTAEQVEAAFARLSVTHPGLDDRFWLALLPEDRGSRAVPGYRLAAVRQGGRSDALPKNLAAGLDEALSAVNLEYRAKRRSRRLGPVRVAEVDRDEFMRRIGGGVSRDSQFKFRRFYPRLWTEATGGAAADPRRDHSPAGSSSRAPAGPKTARRPSRRPRKSRRSRQPSSRAPSPRRRTTPTISASRSARRPICIPVSAWNSTSSPSRVTTTSAPASRSGGAAGRPGSAARHRSPPRLAS